MILSKRERYIVIGTALVLVLLGLDQYLLSPLLKRREEATTQAIAKRAELVEAEATRDVHGRRAANRWREMTAAGLKSDPSETEGNTLNQLRDFAARSGLYLVS